MCGGKSEGAPLTQVWGVHHSSEGHTNLGTLEGPRGHEVVGLRGGWWPPPPWAWGHHPHYAPRRRAHAPPLHAHGCACSTMSKPRQPRLLGVLSTQTCLGAHPSPHNKWPHKQPTSVRNHQVPRGWPPPPQGATSTFRCAPLHQTCHTGRADDGDVLRSQNR